jgi:dTDP-4-amino-4,6-dideoxygalactose transaminase
MNSPGVPFTDLSFQWREIRAGVMPELEELFEKSAFSLGYAVEAFEKEFAAFTGTAYAVGVNSGTSALHLALIAAEVGPGDKVLLPAHTFVATAWAVVYVGATPLLCDVSRDTGTLDCTDAEQRMVEGVKAIIPVHLYGQPADMDAVMALAAKYGLTVIEDAAQSHGAMCRGRPTGSIGAAGCFSFYPGKNLGAPGEAGAVTTSDEALARRLMSLRSHGERERYIHAEVGFNYRMAGIQGLVLSHKLRRLRAWTEERRRLATRLLAGLQGLPLELPRKVSGDHVYHLFVVRTSHRDALRAHLQARGIQTGLHYPVPLHHQPCFRRYAFARETFPIAEHYATQGLSLPLYVGMTDGQVDLVVDTVRGFFRG